MTLLEKSAPFLVLSLLIVIGAASYYPSFKAPFIFDDLRVIVKNREVHVKELSWGRLKNLSRTGRPVAYLSFALNYYFGELRVFGYHLVNLAIHILTALTLYFFLHTTLNLPSLQNRYGGLSQSIAIAASLLFLAHPVQTQAVTYIVQRMTSLCALFFMLSMLCYVKGRLQKGGARLFLYALSGMSAVLAFGSKENAAVLPIFIILYEIYFFQGFELGKVKKLLGYLLGLMVLPLIVGSFYLGEISAQLQTMSARRFTLAERLLTELRVVMHYLSLLIFPHPSRLNLDHDFSVSRSLFNPPSTFLALLGLLGLIFLGIYLAKKRPLISFGIVWFLGNLVIESTVIPLELIYEHRIYLPSAGFFLVLASFCLVRLDSWKLSPSAKRGATAGGLALLISLLGFWTYQRNLVWQDNLTLWADVVKKSPNIGRAHDNLALAYFRLGQYDKAIPEHLKGIKLGGPALHKKLNNLGNAYFKTWQYDKAIESYAKAIKLNPNFVEAHNGLGVAYNAKGSYAEAEKELLRLTQLAPRHPGAYSNLGLVYTNQKLYEKAAWAYKQNLKINLENPKSLLNLGKAYAKQGLYDQAITAYKKLLRLKPKDHSVYNALGSAYAEGKMYREAEEAFRQTLAIDGNSFPARKNLGNIYYLLKLNDKAIEEWKKALALNPKDKVLAKNLEIVQRKRAFLTTEGTEE